MNDFQLLDALYGLLLMALGALFTMIRETVKDQQRNHKDLSEKVDQRDAAITAEIAALRNTVSKDYMPRAEVVLLMGEIKDGLQRICDKLDGKQDKVTRR